MTAPTTELTTADLSAVVAHPLCPPPIADAWDNLTKTADQRARALRRRDRDEAEDWARFNDQALTYLDKTLTRYADAIPALIAGVSLAG
jgi:hypothetical protein